MLSQKAKYALRAMIALAAAPTDRPLQTAEIAKQHKLPRKFLEQILLELKNAGLVHSKRGKMGGYHLAKPAAEIDFAQIVREIDGPLALLPCVSKRAYRRCDDCHSEETCAIRQTFARVREASIGILEKETLADALSAEAV